MNAMQPDVPAVAACGIYNCETCDYRAADLCPGCEEGNRANGRVCRVFACVGSRGMSTCAGCAEAACALRRSVESICPLRSRFEKKRWWAGRMSRALESHKGPAREGEPPRMSARVISRLRWYLTALEAFAAEEAESVSSWQLAERVGVSAALIRKDLSRFGEFGTPSFGYRVDFLRDRLRSILGLDSPKRIVWVGACSLRHGAPALARLARHSCEITAVFDADEGEIGTKIGEHEVLPLDAVDSTLLGKSVSAAVIALPGPQAQAVAMKLVELGAQAVLNMSGELLILPGHVKVSSLDLEQGMNDGDFKIIPGDSSQPFDILAGKYRMR